MFLPEEVMDSLGKRGLYSEPPIAQTTVTRNPALLVSWWCTAMSLTIILLRLAGRYIRTEELFREDKIMALGIIPLMTRMAFVHCVLRWGTNNADLTGMTDAQLHDREKGAMYILPARVFYAAFLWICKLAISEFLKRLNFGQSWKKSYQMGLETLRWSLGATFVAVVISIFAECRPASHLWQVLPDPGPQCRQAYANLLTVSILDAVTDLALVLFPITIVLRSKMPNLRKFSLTLLFSLSLVLIAITLYRISETVSRHGNQQFRTLLASIEVLAATTVANAIVLGSFVRDRGVKKRRWKLQGGSVSSVLDKPSIAKLRRPRPTVHSWGSDFDLIEDLGLRLGPEFQHDKAAVVRPAPAVMPLTSPGGTEQQQDHSWPKERSMSVATDMSVLKNQRLTEEMPDTPNHSRPASLADVGGLLPPDISSPRSMAFFDVGGLLEDAEGRPIRRSSDGAIDRDRAASPFRPLQSLFSPILHPPNFSRRERSPLRIGNIIEDIGGLPGPSRTQHFEGREETPVSPLGVIPDERV